ncbi:hypothetical protein [Streptomyces sp. NPDC059708]|uniref:hypothetical protein n=1 Tax=Streptomyces sp. NPDC059708 TaxID=3346916 RepID=UPI0036B41973
MTFFRPPEAEFLPGIAVQTIVTTRGVPIVTLYHPHAHERNTAVETAMTAIGALLGLRYGRHFRRSREYIYDIDDTWYLDYRHPQHVLCFPVAHWLWPYAVRGRGGALVAVCLEHEPSAPEGRIMTGSLALRRAAPRDWPGHKHGR